MTIVSISNSLSQTRLVASLIALSTSVKIESVLEMVSWWATKEHEDESIGEGLEGRQWRCKS